MPTIRIDTSALAVRTFRLDGLDVPSFDGSAGVNIDLAAGSYVFHQLNTDAQIPFLVTANGEVAIDMGSARCALGGTNTLTVHGLPITIDGTGLPHDLDTHNWYIDNNGSTTLSRSTTHQVNLLPLPSPTYRFLSPTGEWSAGVFNIAFDGTIEVDPQYAQTFVVSDTTLTVTGFPITIDGTALPHDLDTHGWYHDDDGSTTLSRKTTHDVTVLPLQSSVYRFLSPTGVWSAGVFNVSLDGQVVVDPQYQLVFQPFANTLTVTGALVSLDAMGLPHDLRTTWCFDDNGSNVLSRTQGHLITVMPLQTPAYRFLSPTGASSAGVFNIALDGTIDVDPQYAQTFVVSDNLLTVTGFQITIDGRSLSHDLDTVSWYHDATGATTLSRNTTHQVTVLPLQAPVYRFLTPAASWTDAAFNVSPDGQLQVAPEDARNFVVTDDVLTVRGYAIRIEGRALAHGLSLDGFSAIMPMLSTNQTLVLLPLMAGTPYIVREQPAQEPAYRFLVNSDGTVTPLDPGPTLSRTGPASGRLLSELRRAVNAAEIAYDRFDFLVNAGPAQAATYGTAYTAAQQSLATARAALASAASAELPLWPGDDHPVPVLLWPVRLEVRYFPNEQHPTADPALAIRVIPDDVAIQTFEPELTDTEYQAAQSYWTTVSAPAATDDDKSAAWSTILTQLGPARAAWAVEVMHPTLDATGTPHFPDVGHRDTTWTQPATSLLLPNRFIFRGWRNGNIAFEVVGADVPAGLTFGPDPVELSGDQPPPFGWSTGAQWMIHFDEAVGVGMGVVVPLDGPNVAFDEIMVLGIVDDVADDAPDDAATRLARSLQGHLYTNGMTFPPSDAPTNNTPGTRSDWTSAPTMRTPDEVAAAVAAEDPTGGQPAVRLADALGFTGPATPGQPGRRDLLTAAGGTDRDDEHDFSRSWQVFQALEPYLDDDTPTGWLTEPDIVTHFTAFVRPRGPLPPVRIGRQPYGILPVTPLALWVNAAGEPVPDQMVKRLLGLHGFIGRYLPMSPRVGRGPDQDEVLMDLLRRLPESTHIVPAEVGVGATGPQQHVLPDLFPALSWTIGTPAISNPVTLAARGDQIPLPLVDMVESVLQWLDDLKTVVANPGTQLPPEPPWVAWASDPDALATLPLFAALMVQTIGMALLVATEAIAAGGDVNTDPLKSALGKLTGLTQLTDWVNGDQGHNDRLLAAIIEAQTSRVDAWATSLATARLQTVRTAAPTGIRVGAYGWLVDVQPTPPVVSDTDAGWVMTPSMQHAATAAVLHSGYAAHANPQAFAVDLTSTRVRTALSTLAALRQGRTLEELLGYQLERALHDAGADNLIAPLRQAFPLPPADPTLGGATAAAAAAADHGERLVVDGDAARRNGTAFINQPRTVPLSNLDKLAPLLADLDDTVDAMGDVLLAESVHQLVGGSPLRAGLAADTVGKAAPVPDTFDVLTTPRSHVTVSHTAAVALAVGAPAGWHPSPRAALDPVAETLAGWALGSAADWTVTITAADGSPTAFPLADVDTAAIDVIVEATDPIDSSALAAWIRSLRGAEGTVTIRRADALGADSALPVLANTVRAVLSGARPAAAAGTALSPTTPGPPADLPGLAQRIDAWWAAVTAALAAWPNGSSGDQATAIATLARAGVSGIRFDSLTTVGPALQQRLSRPGLPIAPPAADADPTAWLAGARGTVAAVVGGWFTAAPLWTGGLADWAELGGDLPPGSPIGSDDVEDWLRTHRDVRAGVSALCDAVGVIGAVGAGLPVWTVRQGRTTTSPTPLTGWVGRAHPGARSAVHLATLRVGAAGAPSRALLLIDQWLENLPAAPKPGESSSPIPDHTAGLGFRVDRPDARAPQALLLAVPPDLTRGWALEDLHAAVEEALWWTRARPLDSTDLPELRWALG